MHPLSEQCPARSKRTGERCKRLVVGSGPCYLHGGRARQVNARREQRIALWEAQQAQPVTVIEPREPEQALLDLLHDADVTMQKIKSELAEGGVSGPLLAVWGEWLDRTGRIGRIVVDGELEDRLEARRTRRIEWAAENQAAWTQGIWIDTLRAVPLPASAKLLFWDALYDTLREIRERQELPRADGVAVRGFEAELRR